VKGRALLFMSHGSGRLSESPFYRERLIDYSSLDRGVSYDTKTRAFQVLWNSKNDWEIIRDH
jgi:hypothetical protein